MSNPVGLKAEQMTSTTPNISESPNSNLEPVISVEHVDMIFNMASQQMNSLKEYAIAALKGDLFFKEFKALDDINLNVYPGDMYGIVGTNGSGKSTLLKIVAGVLEPSSGTCTIRGSIAPLIELGAGFDMELTAYENIYLNGALLGYTKEFIAEHLDEIVDFAEVRDFLDMPMKNFSSGMIARVAFSVATVTVPDILVVDEALSVGDFLFQRKCEERIQAIVGNNRTTLLFVSHSIDQVERVCNKAIWIEKGKPLMKGDVKDVCEAYRLYQGKKALDPEQIKPATLLLEGNREQSALAEANNVIVDFIRLETGAEGFFATERDPQCLVSFRSPQILVDLQIKGKAATSNTLVYYDSPLVPGFSQERILTLEIGGKDEYHKLLAFEQGVCTLRFDFAEEKGETGVMELKLETFCSFDEYKERHDFDKENLESLFEPQIGYKFLLD